VPLALHSTGAGSDERHCDTIVQTPYPLHFLVPAHLTLSPPAAFPRRSSMWDSQTLSGLHENDSPARSSSPYSMIFTQGSTPQLTLSSGSEPGSESDPPQGYDELSAWIQTPEMASEPAAMADETLHGSPLGYPSAATGFPMHVSEAVVQSRQTLPPFRSFDRPVLRRCPSELVTPQTDSNMGCVHMPAVCFECASVNESPLVYVDLARPWDAIDGQAHWDFSHDGVVSV
jgi:hypothetical protein